MDKTLWLTFFWATLYLCKCMSHHSIKAYRKSERRLSVYCDCARH